MKLWRLAALDLVAHNRHLGPTIFPSSDGYEASAFEIGSQVATSVVWSRITSQRLGFTRVGTDPYRIP